MQPSQMSSLYDVALASKPSIPQMGSLDQSTVSGGITVALCAPSRGDMWPMVQSGIHGQCLLPLHSRKQRRLSPHPRLLLP